MGTCAWEVSILQCTLLQGIHGSVNLQAPPVFVVFLCSCDNVYHKQEVCFLLYILGQIVTLNPLD